MPWYSYTGSIPTNSSSYTLVGSEPTCLDPQEKLCAIQATDNGNNEPEFDIALLSEMVQALQDEESSANVLLKQR